MDGSGNAYVVGTTASSDFPGVTTLGAFQPTLSNPSGSAFIAKLFPGSKGAADLLYSTYFGGSGDGTDPDQGYAIAIDSANPPNAYITGQTSSANLPVLGAPAPFQKNLNGTSDGFIAKLTLIPTLVVTPSPYNFGVQLVGAPGTANTFTLTNNTSSTVTFTSITVTGVSPANNTDFVKSSDLCSPAGAAAGGQCTVAVTFTPSAAAAESATLAFAAMVTEGGVTSSQTIDVSLTGTGSATAPAVGFNPPNLAFGGEMLTTTSGPMTMQLTNTGAGPLTISSIAGSGDFTATSTGANACPISPATLPAAGTCSISVTFAPSVLGARTGNVTVMDNAVGTGTQTVPLTGTGWDFSLAGPTQAPPPITSTSPGNFNITMMPLGGFNQNVTLTCAVTPAAADATCTVASPVKAADGMTVQNAAVTVTTTAAMVPPGSVPTPPVSMRQVVPLILALMLLLLVPRTKRLRLRLGMVTAMLMLILLAGCSGSSKPP